MDRLAQSLVASLGILVAAGCGDTSSAADAGVDAAPIPSVDAAPEYVCTQIETEYADLGMVTGTAELRPADEDMPMGPKVLSLQIPLNDDTEPDVLFLELWGGEPPYEDGFVPVTTMLNMDNNDVFNCTSCGYIAADFTDLSTISFNMAYSGTLVIDSVDTSPGSGSIVGTLTNVKFQEVEVGSGEQVPVVGGCRSLLQKVQFNYDFDE